MLQERDPTHTTAQSETAIARPAPLLECDAHMAYGSGRFEDLHAHNRNIVWLAPVEQVSKLVIGEMEGAPPTLEVTRADAVLVVPSDPAKLDLWQGYPGHQQPWQPLWATLLYHTQHRSAEELQFKRALAERVANEPGDLPRQIQLALLEQARLNLAEHEARIQEASLPPHKRFKPLARLLQDSLLYVGAGPGPVEDQSAHLAAHPLAPDIRIANELRSGAALAESDIQTLAARAVSNAREAMQRAYAELGTDAEEAAEQARQMKERLADARTGAQLLLAPGRDLTSAPKLVEIAGRISPPDLTISSDDHDLDVVVVLPSLAGQRPELHQLLRVKPDGAAQRIDAIAAGPDLEPWATVEPGQAKKQRSFQPVSAIIAAHSEPGSDEGRLLQSRARAALDPRELGLHYLGASRELLTGDGWGKSFAARIDREDLPAIKKAIPLYRIACDLLPRAERMLRSGGFVDAIGEAGVTAGTICASEAAAVRKILDEQNEREPSKEELRELAARLEASLERVVRELAAGQDPGAVYAANLERMSRAVRGEAPEATLPAPPELDFRMPADLLERTERFAAAERSKIEQRIEAACLDLSSKLAGEDRSPERPGRTVYCFVGFPGSGKTTQVAFLEQATGAPKLNLVASAKAAGQYARQPDEERRKNRHELREEEVKLITGQEEAFLAQIDAHASGTVILDSFPRSAEQLAALVERAAERGWDLRMVYMDFSQSDGAESAYSLSYARQARRSYEAKGDLKDPVTTTGKIWRAIRFDVTAAQCMQALIAKGLVGEDRLIALDARQPREEAGKRLGEWLQRTLAAPRALR